MLKQSPDLERVVLLCTLNELDRARDWMINLSNQKVINRVASLLVAMYTPFAEVDHFLTPRQDGIEVKIPISRSDLAQILVTRPESILRALHGLADAGEIDLLSPNHILIRSADALASSAGEEALATTTILKVLMRATEARRRP